MAISKEYYWLRLASDYAEDGGMVARVEKNAPDAPISYIWTCGWEVPFDEGEVVEWGPRIEPPQAIDDKA